MVHALVSSEVQDLIPGMHDVATRDALDDKDFPLKKMLTALEAKFNNPGWNGFAGPNQRMLSEDTFLKDADPSFQVNFPFSTYVIEAV